MEFGYGLLHILYQWHIFNVLKGRRLLDNLKGKHLIYKGWALRKKPLVNVLGGGHLFNKREKGRISNNLKLDRCLYKNDMFIHQ